MKQNNDPDFESFLGSIIDWNDYRGDVDDFIKSLPIENLIEYANTYAKYYKGMFYK